MTKQLRIPTNPSSFNGAGISFGPVKGPHDMCRDCADAAGTPWPAGSKGLFVGTCHWCGESDKSLMPFSELEEPGHA